MRFALVFPPQWDPRQPPLGIPVLAGVLRHAGVEVRSFDLNLAMYRRLLSPAFPDGIEAVLLQQLLDERSLRNPQHYLQVTGQLQKIFDTRFDPDGSFRLFWDTFGGAVSPASGSHWRRVLEDPDSMPALRHLKPELADLEAWKPEMIGLSVISDTQILTALALVARWRKKLPSVRLVAGGDALAYRKSLLPALGWLGDFLEGVGVGDGETFLLDLISGIPAGQAAGGIAWDSGPMPFGDHRNLGQTRLAELANSVPPDFSTLPLGDYLTPRLVIPVETARGCPWGRCSFCIHPVRSEEGHSLYRTRSIRMVTEHLAALYAAGYRSFFVVDEALPPARLREVSVAFLTLPGPVSWICYLRLDPGHSREVFELARQSGCRKCFIGLETGSDRLLAGFHKGITAAISRRVLHDLAVSGIAPHLFLMTGFPGETDDDRAQTLDLLDAVLPAFDPFGFSFDLFPLSGELETDLFADPGAFGWQAPARTPQNDLAYQFPVITGRSAQEQVLAFRAEIEALADRVLGPSFGLRHAALAQDSLHLLFLD